MLNNMLLFNFSALTYTNSKIFTRAIIDKKSKKYYRFSEKITNPGILPVNQGIMLHTDSTTGAVKSP